MWHSTGDNINDVQIDRDRGDAVFVGMDDGRAWRIEQDGTVTLFAGSSSSGAVISLDADGDLWVLRGSAGALYEVDRGTQASTLQASYGDLDSSYVTSNRVAVNPADGTVWSASYYDGIGGAITRWDPAAPGQLDLVVSQLAEYEVHPDGLTWHGDCLYVTMPLGDRIATLCQCP